MGETAPIYDISGAEPVLGDIPHDQVQAAISSGKYAFPKGQEINVVSPDGSFGTVPADRAPEALKNGYQYATPSMLGAQAQHEKYSTPGQQVLTGLEGVAQGFAGPAATAAEEGLSRLGVPGLSAKDREARQEENKWTHGLTEAGGFGLGALTGTGEAGLLAKAGEAVHSVTEGASVGSRLAAGAARMATEMGAFQAADEVTKAINQDPSQTPGSVVSNIGLSALLGGAAGGTLGGLGMTAKAALNNQLLTDFRDRMAFRGANVNPNELLQHQVEGAVNRYYEMGSEIGGASGLKAQALQKLMPQMSEDIAAQVPKTIGSLEYAAAEMEKRPFKYGTRIPGLIREGIDDFKTTLAETHDPGTIFDSLNTLKREFDASIPKNLTPDNDNYHALKMLRDITGEIRGTLEDASIWGNDVAGLQKEVNAAWHSAIDPVKQIQGKFMSWVGNELKIDPVKFNSYMNQSGKVEGQTIRQQIMGKFEKAIDQFSKATESAYEKAGVESPFQPISMNAVQESLGKPSTGSKLADIWHDKLGSFTLGNAVGGGVGGLAGHATGIPEAGFAGAYLGRWVLGPIFGALIKPLLEKGASSKSFQAVMAFGKEAIAGENKLTKAAADLFGAEAKVLPSHLYPNRTSIEKLDEQLKGVSKNPQSLLNIAGDMGKYAPDHAQAISQTAMTAVTYLNSLRPHNPKNGPLDSEIPVSKAQMAPFYRTLSIAEQPLLTLEHIKNGTLLPQDVQTLKAIYPSYYNQMSQKLLNSMTDHLAESGSVPYRVRQSLSLFLGQAMDSTLTPLSIQAIQNTYATNGPSSQAPDQQKSQKKGTSKLGKLSTSLQTPDQSRTAKLAQA